MTIMLTMVMTTMLMLYDRYWNEDSKFPTV